MRNRDSLNRRRPFREPRARFLIVCEGKKTENLYFSALRHRWRCNLELKIEAGGTPKTLVEIAAKLKKQSEREAKRDANQRFDEVWCVFDIDEHPKVPDAKQQAGDHGIRLAISNPCFELWALLHFQDQRAHIERERLRQQCRKHMPDYEKLLPADVLEPLYQEALRRASQLVDWQIDQGRPQHANPSTDVHKLTESIRCHRS
jgi:hypothetical protein